MAPSESPRGSSSKSKKPSKYTSDDEEDRPSPPRRNSSHSSSSSKNAEKVPKKSLLKSMFTRDHSEIQSTLASEMFRDDSRNLSSSSKSSKPKTEKVRPEKVVETETYTDEPDFSKFVSTYSEPVKEKKVEKKPVQKKPAEKKKEEKKEVKESPKRESSRRGKSSVRKIEIPQSARYQSLPIQSIAAPKFKTAFKSSRDISMAEKQSRIAELRGDELKQQEDWAQEKLKAHVGTCPMGFIWTRYEQVADVGQPAMGGYRCRGGSHFVSDELLMAGKGEVYKATESYNIYNMKILFGEQCKHTRFQGPRWKGPTSANYDDTSEAYMRQHIAVTYGNIHPLMAQQLLQQLKQKDQEQMREYDMYISNWERQNNGQPWWIGLS